LICRLARYSGRARSLTAGPTIVDRILALIAAHRSAYEEEAKAVTAADARGRRRLRAAVQVGVIADGKTTVTDLARGGKTLTQMPNGKTSPVCAYDVYDIRKNIPEDLKSRV
jgi:hypothetical protein